nr:uncharacterized protein LOC109152193 [Ipomoea batatas]
MGKGRGVRYPEWLLRGFRDAVRESGLFDLGLEGCQFTWERGRGTDRWVQEKLDRVLVTGDWRDEFGGARAWSLEGGSSDHMPILLKLAHNRPREWRRRVRYENVWGCYGECRKVVVEKWDEMSGCDIVSRLGKCNEAAWRWGRRTFRGLTGEIKSCKREMERLREVRGGYGFEFRVLQRRYFAMLKVQSDGWRQRAKELWCVGGEIWFGVYGMRGEFGGGRSRDGGSGYALFSGVVYCEGGRMPTGAGGVGVEGVEIVGSNKENIVLRLLHVKRNTTPIRPR